MTYLLYGANGSGSCTVECALAEIGADYETRNVDLRTGEQRNSEYAAVNVQRKVPSLVLDNGDLLTESVAILLTLDERHPQAKLLPPIGSTARVHAIRWLLFVATEIYPIVEINDYPERFTPDADGAKGGQGTDSVRELAREIWRTRWRVVEEHLAGDPFMLSEGFCLTDIYIAVVSRWAQQDQWRPANLPRVESLTAAVAARPRLAPIWQRHFVG